MKTVCFPYGTGEWDGTIDVELTNKEAALLEESMKKEEYFHLEEDPEMSDIEWKVSRAIFRQEKRQMHESGRLAELKSFNPDADTDELVYEELGNYRICFPNAFDRMKRK